MSKYTSFFIYNIYSEMSAKNGYPTAGLVFLVILLTVMYFHATKSDIKNRELLIQTPCSSQRDIYVSQIERCKIEQVLRECKARRATNKSKSQKILTETVLGAIRGGLGGAVLGGDAGIIPGVVAMGTLSGILSWSRFNLTISRFINSKDTSAY